MPEVIRYKNPFWSWRKIILLIFLGLFCFCLYHLGFQFTNHATNTQPWESAKKFFSAALSPSFTDENPSLPADATPYLERLFTYLFNTLRYAFIAMSMAIPLGLLLGLISSRSWWKDYASHIKLPWYLNITFGALFVCIRFFTTFIRSIHELIWVMLFFSMIGDSPLAACIAIALPFAGTLGKVFSEIIDEQDETPSNHLLYSGAKSLQIFLSTRFVQALPDLITYSFYRLECAVRASAVLGFVGIPTLGLSIKQSFQNLYFGEVWSSLYLLIITIILFDVIGRAIRKRLNTSPVSKKENIDLTLATLKKNTPSWKLLRVIIFSLGFVSVASWFIGPALNTYYSHLTRWERTKNFFNDLIPVPIRDSGNYLDAIPWAKHLWLTNGADALFTSLNIATMALLLSTLSSYIIAPWASRSIANSQPFNTHAPRDQLSRLRQSLWYLIGMITRFLFIITRSIPEYILAYILLSLLGVGIWPLVIALALHNFGILGRLWGEIIENNDQITAKHIFLNGGSRIQAYTFGILPASSNRQLLYIFYRWETCIRESTVLGMLAISSLGYYIYIEKASLRYDSMFFYILIGTAVIFLSDLLSVYLRAKLRNTR
jgi:phosphonate transport system permease protein